MKPAQIESLLDSIEQLQQIMKEIAVGEADLEDEEDSYAQLYKDIDLQLDLLREQGVSVSNPNPFRTLRDWRKHSYSMGKYVDRRVDVYNQYHNTLTVIERFYAHQCFSSGDLPDVLANGLHPQSLKNLLTNIQEIQSIMKQVARGTDIEDKEETYLKKYRELALQITIFQELGLAISNPNCFRSLWQFYNFWDSELESGYAVREKAVDDLYEEISSAIDWALYKYEAASISVEDFAQNMRQHFNQKQLSQSIEDNSVALEDFGSNNQDNLDVLDNTASPNSISTNNTENESVTGIYIKRKQRIQKELNNLQGQYDLISEKIEKFRMNLVITAHFPTQFELEKLIEKAEIEREKIEKKIKEVEERFS